jgi:hypothetical protein
MINQITPLLPDENEIETTPSLPKVGWIRVRRNMARGATSPAMNDATWTPLTSGPYLVPITRWIE